MRIEHEEVAAAQGATAARNMLGADVAHDEVPYFFSDLSDWASLEYLGPAFGWDDEQVEGSVDDGAFAVWYRERDRVRAMLTSAAPATSTARASSSRADEPRAVERRSYPLHRGQDRRSTFKRLDSRSITIYRDGYRTLSDTRRYAMTAIAIQLSG